MRTLVLALAALLSPAVAAQSSTVFPPSVTPYLPLSAEAQAVAEAGAFEPTADPLRMLDNPAVLADFAGGVSVSGELSPRWLGLDDVSTTAFSIASGAQGTVGGRPASVGVGLSVGAFSVPPFVLTDVQGAELGLFDPALVRLGQRVDLRYTYARYTFGENSFDASPAHGLVLRVRP